MKSKLIVLSLLLLTLIACNNNRSSDSILQNRIDSLQIQNDSLTEVLTAKTAVTENTDSPQWYYPETDSRKLLDLGVEDPGKHIKQALRENKDLIPMDAVLGGTMHYNNIQLLGDKWIIADFEDGHVYGKAIFEYTLLEDDKLNFKIIALSEN
ncbi:hypothetical protein [Aequorivita xiaoshiensis]|uniref:Lipoprotein n=1 Tax=Aequorivita xiaoshiensis TaxID=2874476 RepID=A0A9X1QZG2_9FLAO|nr:hypothetical protein [Aequorivita xiaoshiensis]MCG2430400.1 hypothetical protein [Aequorivita xiaoshiensis]